MKKVRKGIVLAGGSGTRLDPLTRATSKQLLPVYNKPMVFYPISTLISLGVCDIAIITTPLHRNAYERLLGDGSQWGVRFTYIVQAEPKGLPHGLLLAKGFLDGSSLVLILGDNIMHLPNMSQSLERAFAAEQGATLVGYEVDDPSKYGVVKFGDDATGDNRQIVDLVEKPRVHISNTAIIGLYFFDAKAVALAETLSPSSRGELEILDLAKEYLKAGSLSIISTANECSWFDAGSFESLHDASVFVRYHETKTGRRFGDPGAERF